MTHIPTSSSGTTTRVRTDHRTPNRTFVNVGGQPVPQGGSGPHEAAGALCVDVADVDDDGWDDLLMCENRALRLYLRRRAGFLDVTARVRDARRVARGPRWSTSIAMAICDLVAITRRFLTVRLCVTHQVRGAAAVPVEQGRGFAIGDIDGRRGPDIVIVQGCDAGINVRRRAPGEDGGEPDGTDVRSTALSAAAATRRSPSTSTSTAPTTSSSPTAPVNSAGWASGAPTSC